MKTTGYIVILADGDFPVHPISLQILHNAKLLAACDGAAKNLLNAAIMPDIAVGDLDSLDDTSKQALAGKLVHVSEQETNDLNKTFRHVLPLIEPGDEIIILGASGKREDHTIGNISLLAEFYRQFKKIKMVTDFGIFQPFADEITFDATPGQEISVLNPNPRPVTVSGSGLKYALDQLALTSWHMATLNEASSDRITLRTGSPDDVLLIYTAYLTIR